MNEETTLPSEVPTDPLPTEPLQTEGDQTFDGTLTGDTIYEDLSGAATEETIETMVITIEEVQSIASDIIHIDLFGSFLVCGTLIGLALLRDRHGY